MATVSKPHLEVQLGCLLPTVFDLTLACGTKLRDVAQVAGVEESVRRQLDAACEKWDRKTCGKVRVAYDLRVVTDQPVREIKACRVKQPSVAHLLGDELYRKATCHMVWVPLPCDFEVLGVHPYTRDKDDYMWIPTTEQGSLDDLNEDKPRKAACHELKEWVRYTTKRIGVRIPSPHKKEYWSKLNDALTPENIDKLNKEIAARITARRPVSEGR